MRKWFEVVVFGTNPWILLVFVALFFESMLRHQHVDLLFSSGFG